MASCFNHSDREATARCALCGKKVCEDCVVKDRDTSFCSIECREKAVSTMGRAEGVLAEKKKTNSTTLVRKLIYFFIVAAVIAAAYHFFYAPNKKEVDQKIRSTVQKVEKSASKHVKETKRAIPTSSQMKRQKENLVK